jgi:hypothetical protein
MRFAVAMVAVLVLGCSATKSLEELSEPAFVWTQDQGLCSKILAVDSAGDVWRDQGCENGSPPLKHVRTAARAQLDTLSSRIDALPLGTKGVTRADCAGHLVHAFARRAAGQELTASACSGSPNLDDLSGLPDEFRAAAEAFLAVQ